MATFEEMAVLIAQLGVNIEIGMTRLVRKVAILIDQGLVFGSPVDTGRFRSNWLVKIGSRLLQHGGRMRHLCSHGLNVVVAEHRGEV